MTASISQDKWKKTRVHQYAPSEHSAKLKAMKQQANSPEQSDRARKNWKKAKTSITCARAFESGGKDHARKRQASFETLPSLDGPKKGGKGVIMATRSSVEAGKLRGYDHRRIDVSTGGGTGKRPKGPEDVGDASRERQLVSAAQKHIREHAGPRAIGASSTRQRLRLTVEPRESTMITNHIIIGDRENARDSLKLQQLGVTHVLNACTQLPNYHPQLFMYRKLDILGRCCFPCHPATLARVVDATSPILASHATARVCCVRPYRSLRPSRCSYHRPRKGCIVLYRACREHERTRARPLHRGRVALGVPRAHAPDGMSSRASQGGLRSCPEASTTHAPKRRVQAATRKIRGCTLGLLIGGRSILREGVGFLRLERYAIDGAPRSVWRQSSRGGLRGLLGPMTRLGRGATSVTPALRS